MQPNLILPLFKEGYFILLWNQTTHALYDEFAWEIDLQSKKRKKKRRKKTYSNLNQRNFVYVALFELTPCASSAQDFMSHDWHVPEVTLILLMLLYITALCVRRQAGSRVGMVFHSTSESERSLRVSLMHPFDYHSPTHCLSSYRPPLHNWLQASNYAR